MQGELLLQKAMDSAMEIVVFFDHDGAITYANQRTYDLLEYSESLVGKCVCQLFPECFQSEQGEFHIEITSDGTEHDRMAYRQNRTCFAATIKVVEQDDFYICLAQDASKETYFEKQAALAGEEAEGAQVIKTQFVANVTHELRTPVNGILGNVRELQKLEMEPQKQALMRLIERGCNDMHSIINNILDFSKLDAGKLELEKTEFQIREMLEYVKSTHINKISEKGLGFFMTVSPDVPETIIGDELRITQILNNLLSNATKFTAVGKIMVEVVKTAQMGNRIELFFMVIDTGIGIAKEDQDKLFKSFSQVEASTTRKYGGTGLGLNISKQLVEMMNGKIHVESEKNKGTIFRFHIWVDVPEGVTTPNVGYLPSYESKMTSLSDLEEGDEIWQFGTPDNIDELRKKTQKLILCVDMENWEKAEMFMETIRQLTQSAPQPVRSASLKLKMSVQKADLEVTRQNFDAFMAAINEAKSNPSVD